MLRQDVDLRRRAAGLARMRAKRVGFVELAVPSPFALPLMVERFREKLTTEKLKSRLDRSLNDMARAAAAADAGAATIGPRRRAS